MPSAPASEVVAEPPAVARSPPGAWRLLAPALLGWGLTAWAVTLPGTGAWIAATAGLLGIGGGLCALGSGRMRRWAGTALLWCAVLLLLGVRIAGGESARADPELDSAAQRSSTTEFAAVLTGFPQTRLSDLGERHWVRAETAGERGGVPLVLWLNERPDEGFAPGAHVELRGTPQRLEPGDSAAYGVSVREIRAAGLQPWAAELGRVAASLRHGLTESAASVPGAELVPGFAVGDTSLVPEALSRAMRESSLAHLTAVSGANCALVTGAAVWVLARLGVGRRWRAVAAGTALLGFVGLVGPDASVQRAAVMAAVLLVSGFGGKRAVSLPALGLAVLALLLVDPWQALQAGFALSVAATAGILLIAAPLGDWLHRRARLPRVLALPVAVAVAAQFACGPLLLLLQPGIPAVGVLANVVAAPVVPIGTGLGLLAALAAPLHPGTAHLIVQTAGLPARWVAATAELTAELPFARWHWPEGWPGLLLLAGCQFALLLAWALHRGVLGVPGGRRSLPRTPWSPGSETPRVIRTIRAALVCAALGVVVGTVVATPLATRLTGPAGWSVLACDVGQGDALLLRDPGDSERTMLVDTGDDEARLLACLDRFGVDRVALLVLSHDDRDHVGALAAVLGRVDAALIAPTIVGETERSRSVVRQLSRAGVPYRIGAAGDTSASVDAFGSANALASGDGTAEIRGLHWEVLAPGAGRSPADTNAASLVMLVRVAGSSVLLLGDTGASEQQRLLSARGAIRAEVLKVAHHGSRDQDPRLYARAGADWGLISVGAGNGYGHPAPDTLAALALAGTQVLRTDRDGAVALVPQPDGSLAAWVERGGVERGGVEGGGVARAGVGGAP